jgi:hypothetical protein
MIGMRYERVLPLPVSALRSTSDPERSTGMDNFCV